MCDYELDFMVCILVNESSVILVYINEVVVLICVFVCVLIGIYNCFVKI